MSTEIYNNIYKKILLIKSERSINLCCVCLQTFEDKDIRSIHDKMEFIFNSDVVVVVELSQALKTLIGQDFSNVLPTICQKCCSSAMISYNFVLRARESVEVLLKAVEHLELGFMDTPKSVLQKCKSMFVDINNTKPPCLIKRHYDKKHNKSIKEAIGRIMEINQYQAPSSDSQVGNSDPLADVVLCDNIETYVNFESEIGIDIGLSAEPEYEPEEMGLDLAEDETEYVEHNTVYSVNESEHAEAESESEHADVETEPEPAESKAEPEIVQKSLKEATKGVENLKYFTCRDCKAGFNSLELYQRHKLTSRKCIFWNRGPFICDYCNYSVAYKHHLIRHIDFKHRGIGVVCEKCGKSFPSNALLTEHLSKHDNEKKFQCKICGMKLRSAVSVKAHTSTHTGEHNYPCYVCGDCFRTPTARRIHINKRHTPEELQKCEDPKHLEKIKKTIQVNKLKFQNEYKKRKANRQRDNEVEKHLIDQQENLQKGIIEKESSRGFKFFNCPDCNAGFNSPERYQKHRLSKRKCTTWRRGYFPCKQCDYSAVYKHWLRHHIQVKHKGNGFVCEECGKVCVTQYILKGHQETHSGEKKFECQVCGKKLRTALSLKNHTTLHTGEKNYPCHICGERFRSSTTRSNHAMKFHLANSPLECEICNKKYTHKRDLLKHQIRHKELENTG